ncbi:hypothetical protein D3C87_1542330 [compost metagenome]
MMRARISVALPAENGTISRIGFAGYWDCAMAACGSQSAAISPKAVMGRKNCRLMVVSSRCKWRARTSEKVPHAERKGLRIGTGADTELVDGEVVDRVFLVMDAAVVGVERGALR